MEEVADEVKAFSGGHDGLVINLCSFCFLTRCVVLCAG